MWKGYNDKIKKVLFHIDEREKWGMVLKNVQNMMNHYEQTPITYHIEIVANGEAVKDYSLISPRLQDVMWELIKQNVLFVACNNALEASELTTDDIFTFVVVVPIGVVEIADRQFEGYAYIMP